MSELHGRNGSNGLEELLRAALGDHGPVGTDGAGRASESSRAKARVLSGIRHRRIRRLQVSGLAAVALVALAVGLPQAFGRSSPPAPSASSRGARGTTGFAANEPAAGSASGRRSVPRTASCQVGARAVTVCGDLAAGSAAQRLSQAAVAHASAASPSGGASTAAPFGPVLVVKPGTTVVVDLPATNKKWSWSTPAIVGSSVPQGSTPPLVVAADGSRGGGQQFIVRARAATTVVLEAREDVFAAKSGANAPMIIPGSAPVWALELQVEGS